MKAKKLLLVLLVTLTLLALALVLPGTASASLTPDHHYAASGIWTVTGGDWYGPKIVGLNHDKWTEMWTGTEPGLWEGTFQGTSVEPFKGEYFRNGGFWFIITVNFTGSVYTEGGELIGEGEAVIRATVNDIPEGPFGMGGRWTVAKGSGGLQQLHGMGTWFVARIGDLGPEMDYIGEVWLQ